MHLLGFSEVGLMDTGVVAVQGDLENLEVVAATQGVETSPGVSYSRSCVRGEFATRGILVVASAQGQIALQKQVVEKANPSLIPDLTEHMAEGMSMKTPDRSEESHFL
jgi:hypothetical protein